MIVAKYTRSLWIRREKEKILQKVPENHQELNEVPGVFLGGWISVMKNPMWDCGTVLYIKIGLCGQDNIIFHENLWKNNRRWTDIWWWWWWWCWCWWWWWWWWWWCLKNGKKILLQRIICRFHVGVHLLIIIPFGSQFRCWMPSLVVSCGKLVFITSRRRKPGDALGETMLANRGLVTQFTQMPRRRFVFVDINGCDNQMYFNVGCSFSIVETECPIQPPFVSSILVRFEGHLMPHLYSRLPLHTGSHVKWIRQKLAI